MSVVAFSIGKGARSKCDLACSALSGSAFFALLVKLLSNSASNLFIADQSVNKTALSNPGPGAYASPEKNIRYKSSPSWK